MGHIAGGVCITFVRVAGAQKVDIAVGHDFGDMVAHLGERIPISIRLQRIQHIPDLALMTGPVTPSRGSIIPGGAMDRRCP